MLSGLGVGTDLGSFRMSSEPSARYKADALRQRLRLLSKTLATGKGSTALVRREIPSQTKRVVRRADACSPKHEEEAVNYSVAHSEE
jgi:hypothetical protein